MFPWRLRLLLISCLGGLYIMVASLLSVTQRDAATLADRRILQEEVAATVHATVASLGRGARLYRSRQPWPRAAPIHWCRPLGIKAAPGPVTALASFPGSGNTWLRYLLQQATGVNTGSVYKDFALMKNGFPLESVSNGSVLVVKTHEWGSGGRAPFQAGILLLREPGPSILAEFNRRSGGHIGHASPEKFLKDGGRVWTDFVRAKAREWEDMNTDWLLRFPGPLLVLSYSELRAGVEAGLRRTLAFLGLSLTREQLGCALERQEGIYRRRAGRGGGGPQAGPALGHDLAAMLADRWGRVQRLVAARTQ